MTSRNSNEPEVLGSERRRRWSASEKLAMVRETYEPGRLSNATGRGIMQQTQRVI
jgi:transposase